MCTICRPVNGWTVGQSIVKEPEPIHALDTHLRWPAGAELERGEKVLADKAYFSFIPEDRAHLIPPFKGNYLNDYQLASNVVHRLIFSYRAHL
jgi:hypothetical protein